MWSSRPGSTERPRAMGFQLYCPPLRWKSLAREPEGRAIYGLITGLSILIYMLPIGLTEEARAKGLCL
jgi:hypothetical protein